MRAEADARRCRQDLAAQRDQHERDLAVAGERARVAEAQAAESRAALDVECARATAAEAARDSAQAEATATAQQHRRHLSVAAERVAAVDARAAELQRALERERVEASEAARRAAQAEARSQRDAQQPAQARDKPLAVLPADTEARAPALIGVPNIGLTCHLGACVVALRHIRSFCSVVDDSTAR